uniref:Uncharacterized protein n=1 Tax=Tanacetum cinerariifolium TaxID=118510 RepID=A0A699GF81_TANCI|nr:hypothetical protein [Tanacetum cinerariifolium]
MHRHFVAGQVVVDEKARAPVHHQVFHQRRARAHGHGADDLAARGHRVDDAAGRAHGQHAADADLARVGVDSHFHEVRAERLLRVLPGQVAVFHGVFTGQRAARHGVEQRPAVAAGAYAAVGKFNPGARPSQARGHLFAQLHARRVHARSRRCRAKLAAGTGALRKARVPQFHCHLVKAHAQHFGGRLRQDGVGAGADIGHVGFHREPAVLAQGDARGGFHDRRTADGGGHAHADQPAPFAARGRCGAALLPAEPLGAALQARHQLALRIRLVRRLGIDLRVVQDAQLHRVDAQLFRQFVHRDFQRHHARHFARRAHGARFRQIQVRHLQARHAVGARVQQLGGRGGRFGAVAEIAGPAFVADGRQFAVFGRTQADMLDGRCAVRGVVEHEGALQRHLHRPAHAFGGQRRQHRVAQDRALAAKAAADVRRHDAHIVRGDAEDLGQVAHAPPYQLDRRVQRQLVAVPGGDGGMGFEHRVRVVRRGIHGVHRDFCAGKGAGEVAQCRRQLGVRLGTRFRQLVSFRVQVERTGRRRIARLHQRGSGRGLLERFSHHQRHGLVVMRHVGAGQRAGHVKAAHVQLARVVGRDHGQHAGRGAHARQVDGHDAPLGDAGADHHAVHGAFACGALFVRIGGGARGFQWAVNAGGGLAHYCQAVDGIGRGGGREFHGSSFACFCQYSAQRARHQRDFKGVFRGRSGACQQGVGRGPGALRQARFGRFHAPRLVRHAAHGNATRARHRRDQLPGFEHRVAVRHIAGQAVEVGNRNDPGCAAGAHGFHRGVQHAHGHGHVARMGGDARAARTDHRVLAIDATNGRASGARRALVARLVRVVEIRAARALQQVAGRGGLVAQLARCTGQQCARQHAVIAAHARVGRQVGIAHQGADAQATVCRGLDAVEGQAVDIDQVGWRLDLELHQVQQVGAAGDEARAGGAGDGLGGVRRSGGAVIAADIAAHALADLVGGQQGAFGQAGAHVARDALFDFVEHGHGGADLARGTVAALVAVMLDERSLHRVQLVGRAQAFDGGNRCPFVHHGQRQAGIDAAAVKHDGAGAALAVIAPLLGARQLQVFAQHVEQGGAGIHFQLVALAVDGEGYLGQHWRGGRGGCCRSLGAGQRWHGGGSGRCGSRLQYVAPAEFEFAELVHRRLPLLLRLDAGHGRQRSHRGQFAALPVEVGTGENIAEQMGLQVLVDGRGKFEYGALDGRARQPGLVGSAHGQQRVADGDRAGAGAFGVMDAALLARVHGFHQDAQRIERAREARVRVQLHQDFLAVAHGQAGIEAAVERSAQAWQVARGGQGGNRADGLLPGGQSGGDGFGRHGSLLRWGGAGGSHRRRQRQQHGAAKMNGTGIAHRRTAVAAGRCCQPGCRRGCRPCRQRQEAPDRCHHACAPRSNSVNLQKPQCSGCAIAHRVLLVRDFFQPHHGHAVERFLDRQVRHRRGGRRAVPVLVAGRAPDHVAGADLGDRTAFALGPAAAGRDQQRLADRAASSVAIRHASGMHLLAKLINRDLYQRIRWQFYQGGGQDGSIAVGAEPDRARAGAAARTAAAGAHHAQRIAHRGGPADHRQHRAALCGNRDRTGAPRRAPSEAGRHHPRERRRTCGAHGAATGAEQAAARLSRHSRGNPCREPPDRHRVRTLRRRRAPGRPDRQGHDRRAHQRRHALGRGGCAKLFRPPSCAAGAGRPYQPQLHQHAPAHAWRHLHVGIRKGRTRNKSEGRGPNGVQQHGPAHPLRARRPGPGLRAGRPGAGIHRCRPAGAGTRRLVPGLPRLPPVLPEPAPPVGRVHAVSRRRALPPGARWRCALNGAAAPSAAPACPAIPAPRWSCAVPGPLPSAAAPAARRPRPARPGPIATENCARAPARSRPRSESPGTACRTAPSRAADPAAAAGRRGRVPGAPAPPSRNNRRGRRARCGSRTGRTVRRGGSRRPAPGAAMAVIIMRREGLSMVMAASDIELAFAHPLDDGGVAVREEAAGGRLERGDAGHVVAVELEIEHVEVFRHPLAARGLGQRHHLALHQPAQDDLADRLVIARCDIGQHGILEQVVAPFRKRRPRFGLHAVVLHELHAVFLLVERIDLHLVDGRLDVVEGDQVHQTVGLEIAHAYRAQLAGAVGLFHRAPRAVHVAERLMDQVQVQVVELQPLQRLVDGGARGVVARVLHPQLAGDEQVVARHAAVPDALPHGALVQVGRGRVDQAVAGGNRSIVRSVKCDRKNKSGHQHQRQDQQTGGTGQCRVHAVQQQGGAAGPVRTNGGHRHQRRQSQRVAQLVRDIDHARRRPRVPGRHANDAGRRQRAQRQTLADADQHHRQRHGQQVSVFGRHLAQPRHADGAQRQAGGQQAAVTEAARQARHLQRHHEINGRHGQERQAGHGRRIAEHRLQVLGREKEKADHRSQEQQPGAIGRRPRRHCKQAQRHDGLCRMALVEDECDQQQQAAGHGALGGGVQPAGAGRADQAVHERRHAGRGRHCPQRIEVAGAARAFLDVAQRRPDHGGADRQVDEETHAPRQPLGQHAAQHQPHAGGNAGHGAVIRHGAGALGAFGKRGLQQRQRRWREDGGAQALHGPRAHHHGRRGRQADGQRGQREHGQAQHQHAAPSDQVAGARGQQQKAAKSQRVGALHPGQARIGKAQVAVDAGQAGQHDGRVEHDHHVADEDDGKDGRLVRRDVGSRHAMAFRAVDQADTVGQSHWCDKWGKSGCAYKGIAMRQTRKTVIDVQGAAVTVLSDNQEDYISLTDMLRANEGDFFISDWLRNRNTVEFLSIWERLNNPDVNYGEFAIISRQVGLNSYKLSVKDWVKQTNAIGLRASTGRYGGTYAHQDIAFEFGMWISPEFKLYLVKEFRRLKEDESKRLSSGWDLHRTLNRHDNFKQVAQRGHPVSEVAERLGVSIHSLYAWTKRYGMPEEERKAVDAQSEEMRRLKAELKRVTEERDILKKAAAGLTPQEKSELWNRWKDGQSLSEIGRALGKHAGSIHTVLAAKGGIMPRIRARRANALTCTEREEISRDLAQGISLRKIASRLQRSPSTISREIQRNGGPDKYRATTADAKAWELAARPKPCLLACNKRLARLVAGRLKDNWSPQQISGWLAREHKGDPEMQISHETIYRSLFIQARGVLKRELIAHLRSRRMMRRGKTSTTEGQPRGRIPDAVSIRERPACVEERAVPGHGTLGSVINALVREVKKLPDGLMETLTWDRGGEMAQHKRFTVSTDVAMYFCDPQSPWQRGTNENTNRLLRQHLPDGTDLTAYSQRDLNAIARKLNTRPRKTLAYMTPGDKLAQVLP